MKPEFYEGETVMITINNNWERGVLLKIEDNQCKVNYPIDKDKWGIITLPKNQIYSFNLARFIEGQKGNN